MEQWNVHADETDVKRRREFHVTTYSTSSAAVHVTMKRRRRAGRESRQFRVSGCTSGFASTAVHVE